MPNYPISVFLDSNAFIGATYNFSSKSKLKYLSNLVDEGKVKLYTSHIVIGEVRKHLTNASSGVATAINKTKKEVEKIIASHQLQESSIADLLQIVNKEEFISECIGFFDNYILEADIELLESDDVDCNEIINNYFNHIAPFEENEKKKYEFPDAFMISQLKATFSNENPLWVVCEDKGFRDALKSESWATLFTKTEKVLDSIIKEEKVDKYRNIESYINIQQVKDEIFSKITDKILDGEFTLDGNNFDPRDGGGEDYDYEESTANDVENLEYISMTIDEISEDSVQVTLTVTCKIETESYFEDYANAPWDSEDKKYVWVDTVYVYEAHEPTFDCNITLLIDDDCVDIGNTALDVQDIFEVEEIDFELNLDSSTLKERRVQEPNYYEEEE